MRKKAGAQERKPSKKLRVNGTFEGVEAGRKEKKTFLERGS